MNDKKETAVLCRQSDLKGSSPFELAVDDAARHAFQTADASGFLFYLQIDTCLYNQGTKNMQIENTAAIVEGFVRFCCSTAPPAVQRRHCMCLITVKEPKSLKIAREDLKIRLRRLCNAPLISLLSTHPSACRRHICIYPLVSLGLVQRNRRLEHGFRVKLICAKGVPTLMSSRLRPSVLMK